MENQEDPRRGPHQIDAPAAPPGAGSLDRRALLRAAGIGAVAGAAAAHAQPARAQTPPPLMRTAGVTARMSAAAPPLVAPELIALNRMALGLRPGDLAALMAMGADSTARLTAYVEQQLDPVGIDDSACDAQLAAQNFVTLQKPLAQLWADHHMKPDLEWWERQLPLTETRAATFIRAIYSRRQLVEVLADFWHNHFNVYAWDFWPAPVWVHYDRDVLRANLFGNFRQMLGAVAKSAPMLYYLDNVSNSSAGPNENYARELFELHTLGAENYFGVASIVGPDGSYQHPAPVGPDGKPAMYVDEDVYSATQCFTGWQIDEETGQFFFNVAVHAKYAKVLLDRVLPSDQGQQDGETVLDILANHAGTARCISRKLCRRLIGDNPPDAVVQAAADVFYAQRAAPDQLKQVVRTILLSPEFRTTWGEKIKRPFEFAVSLLRAAEADFAPQDNFFWSYEDLGQPLFGWRPPDGYPDVKEDWSSTMPLLQRWRLTNWLMDGWRIGGDGADRDNLRVDVTAQHPAALKTPIAIVDFWSQRILGRLLPPDERQEVIDFMAAGRNPDYDLPAEDITDRLRFMVGLIFMSPAFQWR